MLTKRLTSYIYLHACGTHKAAARLDPIDRTTVNAIITETSQTCKGMFGEDIKLHDDQHYLVGEIADRLYAYEQLGYSPEELKEIIAEHKRFHAADEIAKKAMVPHLYVMPGRQNGKSLLNAKYALQLEMYGYLQSGSDEIVSMQIENVIFNDPATIVFWKDGTKTVVKATNEDFDPEKGLAMAISKKALGNKGNYFDAIKKWTKKYKKKVDLADLNVGTVAAKAATAMKKLADALAPKVTKEGSNDLSEM